MDKQIKMEAGNEEGIKEVLNKRDKMHHCSNLVKMFVESTTVRLPFKALLFKISFNLYVIGSTAITHYCPFGAIKLDFLFKIILGRQLNHSSIK